MVRPKYLVIAFLVFLIFAFYYYEGYFSEASPMFNVFYIVTILISAYALSRLELLPIVIFALLAAILGVTVEFLNTLDGNWTYFNGGQPPVFVAIGWAFLLALIFFISGYIKNFLNAMCCPLIPVGICFIVFFILSFIGGYLTPITIILYLMMALLAVYFAYNSSLGWTIGVLVAGIIVGTGSELLGASAGLWSYQFGEAFPMHMAFAWAANAFCILGLLKLLEVDGEELFSK